MLAHSIIRKNGIVQYAIIEYYMLLFNIAHAVTSIYKLLCCMYFTRQCDSQSKVRGNRYFGSATLDPFN